MKTLKVFKTKADIDNFYSGQRIPSGVLVMTEDENYVTFTSNNIDGSFKRYEGTLIHQEYTEDTTPSDEPSGDPQVLFKISENAFNSIAIGERLHVIRYDNGSVSKAEVSTIGGHIEYGEDETWSGYPLVYFVKDSDDYGDGTVKLYLENNELISTHFNVFIADTIDIHGKLKEGTIFEVGDYGDEDMRTKKTEIYIRDKQDTFPYDMINSDVNNCIFYFNDITVGANYDVFGNHNLFVLIVPDSSFEDSIVWEGEEMTTYEYLTRLNINIDLIDIYNDISNIEGFYDYGKLFE